MMNFQNTGKVGLTSPSNIKAFANVLILTATPFSAQAAEKCWSFSSCGPASWGLSCQSATFGGAGQPIAGDNVYLYNNF